jgi:4'-phosphopantetheinyl transferase
MATNQPDLPLPLPGEAHVYWADLDGDPQAANDPLLDPAERGRASRFRQARHRAWFAAARATLRRLLATYVGGEPGQIHFEYGAHGKPRLGGRHAGHPLRFNLSHDGPRALYAVTSQAEVGVDLEALRPIPDALELAERFFSPAEFDGLRRFPASERGHAFLRCWTRKEAFVKALGDGLGHPLDQFSVSLEDAPEVEIAFAGVGPVSQGLLSFRPDEQHVAALAVLGSAARITRFETVAERAPRVRARVGQPA